MYTWILIIVIAALLVLKGLIRRLKPKVKGASGEASVSFLLSGLPKDEYTVLHNILLGTEQGTTQIDHVVVSVYGIFVIEVKNYTGWITGTEWGKEWTQTIYRTKNRFMNPIRQNYGHVKAIQALVKDPSVPVYPIVTFPGDAVLKVSAPQAHVVKWGALRDTIRSLSKEKVTDSAGMQRLVRLLHDSNIDSPKARRAHVAEVNAKKAASRSDRNNV